MRNLHKEITDRIVARLETGVAPWRKPWSTRRTVGETMLTLPRNALTGKPYSGINILLLWGKSDDCGFTNSRWLTFRQAKSVGASVRKGEKGTEIVFVSSVTREDRNDPTKLVRIPFLKSYYVFNVAQVDNLPAKYLASSDALQPVVTSADRNETVDAFVAATNATIQHGGDRAFFTTGGDYVQMPPFAAFDSADAYYSTLFHELGHWTGGPARLNRTFGKRFADRAYAVEELVAELSSAFVCAEFGIDMADAPVAYIANWLSAIKADDKILVAAASAASKAVEFMRNVVSAEDEDADELAIAA